MAGRSSVTAKPPRDRRQIIADVCGDGQSVSYKVSRASFAKWLNACLRERFSGSR